MNINLNNLMIAFFFAAFVFLTTPWVKKIAWRTNWVDKPVGRKDHNKATAYLGGTVITLNLVALIFIFILDATLPLRYLWAFFGVLLLFLVGVYDDKKAIPSIYKLGFQMITTIMIILSTPSYSLLTFLICIPIGILIINSFNLIDGRDGLAIGVAVMYCLPLALLSYLGGSAALLTLTLGLSFSLLGIFPFNKYPAQIFLGDGGSLSLGSLLFFLSIQCFSLQGDPSQLVAWLPLLLGVPVIDTFAVMAYRYCNGLAIMKADHNHLHHLLEKKGLSHPKLVELIHLITFPTCCLWLSLIYFNLSYHFFLLLIPIWFFFYKSLRILNTKAQ